MHAKRVPGARLIGSPVLLVALSLASAAQENQPAPKPRPIVVTVGATQGDFRGTDGAALQAAVDYVAGLGGGTVRIASGRYLLRNALKLRSHVHISGEPGKTVLAACDGVKVRLAVDGDCNERQITLDDPSGFRVGDGVVIQDERNGWGYYVTTATLTAQVGDRSFRLSQPLYLDYMMRFKATAALSFPVVGGWDVRHVTLDGLTLDGNRGKSAQFVDGCRAGGIYLHECSDITIRNCTVRAYNGDGIVCGVSERVTVEDCASEENAGHGLHPGSGSSQPTFRRNRAVRNGHDGLFVCWRVRHGLFADNDLQGNQRDGISIGHRDTDNHFRKNRVIGNARAGIFFRDETEPMGAHRNVFEDNLIQDNGTALPAGFPAAAVVVLGHHHDLVFRGNTIGNRSAGGTAKVGIQLSKVAQRLREENNTFTHLEARTRTAD
jgi:parallel beta-helix repeat protein